MKKVDVGNWLRNYFSEEFAISEIDGTAELINDLGLTSLEVLSMLSDVEDEFNISISSKLTRNMVTFGDMEGIIKELVTKN